MTPLLSGDLERAVEIARIRTVSSSYAVRVRRDDSHFRVATPGRARRSETVISLTALPGHSQKNETSFDASELQRE